MQCSSLSSPLSPGCSVSPASQGRRPLSPRFCFSCLSCCSSFRWLPAGDGSMRVIPRWQKASPMARLFAAYCRKYSGVDTLVLHASRCVVAHPLAMFRFVLGVVAGEELHMGIAFERQNVRGDTVEEPTVVGDHQGTAGEG